MPQLLFADNFLAGAILSLVMPTLLLISIAVWFHLLARRIPRTPTTSTQLPPRDVLAAAAVQEGVELPPPGTPAESSTAPPAEPPASTT